MRYQIRHALVQYAADTILEDVNFEVHDNEKIARMAKRYGSYVPTVRISIRRFEASYWNFFRWTADKSSIYKTTAQQAGYYAFRRAD